MGVADHSYIAKKFDDRGMDSVADHFKHRRNHFQVLALASLLRVRQLIPNSIQKLIPNKMLPVTFVLCDCLQMP